MPHIVIEHANLPAITDRLNHVADAIERAYHTCECIVPANVKLRTQGFDTYRVGGAPAPFVHITLLMMAGRTDGQKAELADKVFAAATGVFTDIAAVTFELREMDPATYRKRPPATNTATNTQPRINDSN